MTFNLTNRFNITDAGALELVGVLSATTAVVGGTTYLFAAGRDDDGISVFSVGANGLLTNVANVVDDATLQLDEVNSLTVATIGGTTYLFAAGGADDGISVFTVGPDGTLSNVANVTDDATLELDGVASLTTAVVGGATYLFAAGRDDFGVSVFSVAADGTLGNVANVSDGGALNLRFASSVTAAEIGGITYLFAGGFLDNGISVFSVAADGSLTNVANVGDTAALELAGVISLTTAVVDGATYLFAAGFNDNGVSAFKVNADGSLTNTANVTDTAALNLRLANSVTTATIGDTTYLFVAGTQDNGVSMFAVGGDGSLTHVTRVTDDLVTAIGGASAVTTVTVGGIPYLIVTGFVDNGVSVFEIPVGETLTGTTGADALNGDFGEDLLVGFGGDDALAGGSGNDIIIGGDGDDTLTGGAGDDDLYGDDGTDTAVFSGNQADYLIIALGNGAFAVLDQRSGSPDGLDTLDGVESLAFADGTASLVGDSAPTDLALSHTDIAENSALGALVGALSATDPDTGETFTYQLLDDAGGRFALDANLIEVAGALDFETATSHQITVRVTDSGGLTYDEIFTIAVTDVAEGGVIPPANAIHGGAGEDILDGRGGIATLTGGAGNDTFYVDDARAIVVEAAGGGTDRVLTFVDYTLTAGSHVEILDAAVSSATTPLNLTGNELVNTVIGNAGDNVIDGGGGADTLFGNGGNDTYFVDNADDQVFESAGEGTDRVLTSVDYTLTAGSHVETLDAAVSSAVTPLNLTGNELANTVIGNAGDNILNGGFGNDVLFGRAGADTFLFDTALDAANNVDFIGDFNQADDVIALDHAIFSSLATEAGHFLIGTEFHIGSAAGDADDRIIYDGTSGALFYDSDGIGGAAQVQFATLAAGLALVNDDFIVV